MLTAALASAVGVLLFVVLGLVVGQDQLWSWRVVPIIGVTALWAGVLSPLAMVPGLTDAVADDLHEIHHVEFAVDLESHSAAAVQHVVGTRSPREP